jgi:tRNA-2-methylthio-N6-dimethylallyladenosine synthase
MKFIYIKTWGCQMNEYDSSMIITLLQKKNEYSLTESIENADILILNTCSIREKAQEKLFHQLGRWKKIKNKNPEIIIAVGGCVANQEGKEIFKRANYVDIIFGTQTLHRLPKMISEVEKK